MAYTRQDYFTNDNSSILYNGANRWNAQTFTTTSTYTISRVRLKLYKTGSPGNITVHIQGVDGSDEPDNSDKASGSASTGSLTTDSGGEWIEILLDVPVELTNGIRYAIVLKAPGSDADNQIGWRRQASNNLYANGRIFWTPDAGSDWYTTTNYDHVFETYSGAGTIYADLAGTGGGTGGGSAILGKTTMANLVGTGGGIGGGSAALIVSGFPSEGAGVSRTYKRVVAAGNDQIFYEDI